MTQSRNTLCDKRGPVPPNSTRDRSSGASLGGRGSWPHSTLVCGAVIRPNVTWNKVHGQEASLPSHIASTDAVSGGATTDTERVGFLRPKPMSSPYFLLVCLLIPPLLQVALTWP